MEIAELETPAKGWSRILMGDNASLSTDEMWKWEMKFRGALVYVNLKCLLVVACLFISS